RLTHDAEQLGHEAQGLGPRREAVAGRARAEVRWLYHLVQGQAIALRGGPEAMLDHVARADHLRRTLHATLRELNTVTLRASAIVADRARVDALLGEAHTRHDALERQHAQLEALGNMRLTVTQAGLAGDPIAGAGDPSTGGVEAVTLYGGAVAETSPDSASFGDAAGRLLFPVAGRAEVRRARREGAEGPGVEIAVPRGTPVRAVFVGRVAFADRYGAYGRIVILDHGDHYYTVSANLGAMSVHVGEEVSAGTVIGTVGDDGRGPMLYFEVRRGSETVDPGPFLGL
ncbi:MAG: M23 family metallopeptidase, partial [Deltaproteobacteria bacterium]